MAKDGTMRTTHALELDGRAYVEMAPLGGLTGDGLSVQLWLRPQATAGRCRWVDLGGGPGGERLALVYDGEARALSLEGTIGGVTFTIVRGVRELAKSRWIHVSATLGADGTGGLFVDGERLADGRVDAPNLARLRGLLAAPVLARCVLGRGFTGALAELRAWSRRLKSSELAWRSRVRGDEAGLMVCHRLDALADGVVVDHGPRGGHGREVDGARAIAAADLPLSVTHDPAAAHLRVRGRLCREHLPLDAFPGDRVLVPGSSTKDVRRANAEAFGDIEGDTVLCSLYEVIVEPRAAGDEPVDAATIAVVLDGPTLVVVDDEAGDASLRAWDAGRALELPLPLSGKLRLRLVAGDALDCPAVRVRWSALAADQWYAVRPAERAHAGLRGLTGEELLRPGNGARSPLPPGTSREDADALAELLAHVADGLSPAPARAEPVSFAIAGGVDEVEASDEDDPVSFGVGSWLKKTAKKVVDGASDAVDVVADAAGDAVKAAEKASRQASKFVVRTAKDSAALLSRAAKVEPKFGRDAICGCICEAATVALATAKEGASWRTLTLAGTRLVDGVEECWRVVVHGLEDMVSTIGAFFARVGAELRALIDMLAALFDWGRFLRTSDRMYALARRSFDEFGAGLERQAGGMFAQIEQLLAAPLSDRLADRSLGEALGIRRDAKVPVLDELDAAVDHVQRLFSSNKRRVAGSDETRHTRDPGVAEATTLATHEATTAVVPAGMMGSPSGLLDAPIRPLLALPLQAWRAGEPVVRPVLTTIAETGATLTRQGMKLATTRIEVPWLTTMIERTILGGRRLDMLRVLALLAAIPAVLLAEVGEAFMSFDTGDSEVPKDLRWLLFATSLVNSIIILGRAVAERDKANRDRLIPLLALNSVVAGVQAGANIALATSMRGKNATYASLACALDCLVAAWYAVYAAMLLADRAAAAKNAQELDARIDQVVEIVLGLAGLLLAVVAACDQPDDVEIEATVGFRVGNWVLKAGQRIADGLDNTVAVAGKVSVGFGGLLVVADLVEAGYYLSEDWPKKWTVD